MRKWLSAAVLLGAAALAPACINGDESKPAQAPAPMVPASGLALTPSQAASVVAEARCDREAKCTGFGPRASFVSRQQCLDMLYHDTMQNLSSCSYGIKDRELRVCATQIRAWTCGVFENPLAWLNRSAACQAASLCLR